jgi:gamma-glutamyl-gamma-aminobutyrate hydrolase PuuD
MRPRIGITTYLTTARWSYWEMPAALLPGGYLEGVRLAGGLPLLLPPTTEGVAEPGEIVDTLDGLVLIGGPDLGVDLYGSPEPHPETGAKEELRDAFEASLGREARERGLPVLGICRGMQLLNVLAGGTLTQHLGDVVDLAPHRPGPGQFGRHPVEIEPGSGLHELLGDEVTVHSTHHQGVGQIGDGLRVAGRAPDGTVEAVEDPEHPFCVGVLWHPEEEPGTGGAPLFWGLVEAARAYRDRLVAR